MHPIFDDLKKYPDLQNICRMDIQVLPQAYLGSNNIKAILLGADPTNDGIKNNKGLKQLKYVFGINSEYEKYFFGPQSSNLKSIKLSKEDLYIQNVCQNYFTEQTSKNKSWKAVAQIWLPYLQKELAKLDNNIPVFVSAEKIMELFILDTPRAEDIYNVILEPYFFSPLLKREIYPLYRHPKYMLTNNWFDYREYLINRIK